MISEERARELRSVIEKVMGDTSDEIAASAPELFPTFNQNGHAYASGDKFRIGGQLYKVLQPHTSSEEWNPENAPSLYAKVLAERDESGEQLVIPVWKQPDSTNAYGKGDKVHFPTMDDPIYESLIDNNVWSPEAYPAGWSEVTS